MKSNLYILFFLKTIYVIFFHLGVSEANEVCLSFYDQIPLHTDESNSQLSEERIQQIELHNAFVEIEELRSAHARLRSKSKKQQMGIKIFEKISQAIPRYNTYLDLMMNGKVKYDESFLLDFYSILEKFSYQISPFNEVQSSLIDRLISKIFTYTLTKKNIDFRIRKTNSAFGISRSEILILGGDNNEFSRFISKIQSSLGLTTVFNLSKLDGFASAVDPLNQIYYINLKSIFKFKGHDTVAHEMFHANNALKLKRGESFLADGFFYDQSTYMGAYKNFALEELKAYNISTRVTATKLLNDRSEVNLQRLKDLVKINLSLAKRARVVLREFIEQLEKDDGSVMVTSDDSSLFIGNNQFGFSISSLKNSQIPKEELIKLLSEKLKLANNYVKVYNKLNRELKTISSVKEIEKLLPAIQLFRNSYPNEI